LNLLQHRCPAEQEITDKPSISLHNHQVSYRNICPSYK